MPTRQFVPPMGRTRRLSPCDVPAHVVPERVPRITEQVVISRPDARATDRGKPPENWDWQDVRSYAVRQIEMRFGPFPMQREPAKLAGICKGFVRRHGALAGPILIAAFQTFGGYWRDEPISFTRLCAGSDPYFAEPIKHRLSTA